MKISYILSMVMKTVKCYVLRAHDIDVEPLACPMIYTRLLNNAKTNEIIDTQYGVCRNCGTCFKITAMPVEPAFSFIHSIKYTIHQISAREFQDATTLLKL